MVAGRSQRKSVSSFGACPEKTLAGVPRAFTASFRILYVPLVLKHERRRVVHFNVTEHPTAQWTGQQLVEAFPWDEAPRYLLRDRDTIMARSFAAACAASASRKSSLRHAPRGRTPTSSDLSVQFAVSASTT